MTIKYRYILKHIAFIAMCFFLAFQSCKPKPQNKSSHNTDEINGELLADTIIYSVVIKNLDSTDYWTEECLSKLNRNKMVDQLFESVYSHQAKVFDYLSDEPISSSDVKAIEQQADFSRDKVGKLQFWESWYYDETQLKMTKKVHSILVAYEVNNQDGELLGYKAAFYIKTK